MAARRKVLYGIGAAALALAGLAALSSNAAPGRVKTMAVDDVRPGMKGHAVTVFKGEKSDRFDIEVVDVIRNYRPRQDAILFTSPDPRMKHMGIVGGMSGSPVFIGGKLVGALAYGYRFNKDPLGGITPIANMLAVNKLPHRPEVLPRPKGRTRSGSAAWADAMLGLGVSPLPPRKRPDQVGRAGQVEGLLPIGVPLTVAGLGPTATGMVAENFGMVPVRGGSGRGRAKSKNGKYAFKPGDALSVVMMQGDSAIAANGTITWVGRRGRELLAFGHPMFGDGPTNVPFASARVHTIIPSVERSVKVSSPLTIQGTMIQDRQAAISLRTGVKAPMVPATTKFRGPDPDQPQRTYKNDLAVAVDITPRMASVILAEAVDEGGPDAVELVLKVKHEYEVVTSKGPRTVEIKEEIFFPFGLIGRLLGRSRGVIVLAAMMDNEFEVADIREIRQTIDMEYGAPVDRIEEIRLPPGEVRAGDIIVLDVVMRSYKGKARIERLPLRIPDDAGGEHVLVEVTGGDYVRPYRPMPSSLDDLVDTLQASYPSRSIVAGIYRQAEGLSTRHGLLRSLPDSVLETLMPSGTTRNAVRLKQMARRVIPTQTLIEGSHNINIQVKKRKTL